MSSSYPTKYTPQQILNLVFDESGLSLSTSSGASGASYTYGYTSGQITTITKTTSVGVYVRTLGYTDGAITSKSDWILQ